MHESPVDDILNPAGTSNTFDLTTVIDDYVCRREAAWTDLRRHLHRHPEPSGEEFNTSELVRSHLAQHRIEARIAPRAVGVLAEFGIGRDSDAGPVIALRADIDALQMADRKSTEYASAVDGCAHACGHDVHTTVMLAVSEILFELNKLHASVVPSARIRLIFQAAEEICQGARWMVEDGAMNDVAAIFGIHVDPNLLIQQIGICYGPLTAQVDEVLISVRGRGGHSARPHNTSDPISAASMLLSMLYQRLPRVVDSRDPSVFTIGQIHGGTAPNVIPDHVEMNGTLRSVESSVRTQLIKTIRETCESFGQLSGNAIAVEFRNPVGSVRNAESVTTAYEGAARDALGDEAIVLLTRPSMGGEDFAGYLDHAPGSQIRLGCANTPNWPLLHSPVFDVDERVIAIGARVVSRAVLKFLQQGQESEFQI